MAVMAGKDGALKIGENPIGYIDSFSMNINNATVETNSIGEQWKKVTETGKDFSGSLSGTLDYADAAQKAVVDGVISNGKGSFDAEFKVGPELTFKGNIVCSGISVTGNWGDKVTISCNFVGNGALTAGAGA